MPTPEEEQARALALYSQSVNTIIQQGREDFGDEGFDNMSKEVTDVIGEENILPLMVGIMQCDAPQRVIEHLAAHPDRAKKLVGVTPARLSSELGRIEAQIMPYGSNSGADPAWIGRAKSGDKSRVYSDAMSDKEFEKYYNRNYEPGTLRRRGNT